MQFDWFTFALQTVNFAILVWLLHRFLYKPVLRLIDARRAEIDKQYAEARAAEAKAEDQLGAIAAERAGIGAERVAALKEAAAQAEDAAAARRAQAEREATALLDSVRKTLATERGQTLVEARRAALDPGMDVALRLLAEVPIKLRTDPWLERIEQHFAALPKKEQGSLIRQLADGVPLKVVTASALPAEAAEGWRAQLRRTLGDGIAIDFEVDQNLIAGAELHFPNAELRFSWQSAIASLRAQIETHGDAR